MPSPVSLSPDGTSLVDAADALNRTMGVRFAARGAALLARQGIEAALDGFWRARAPGVEGCSMRTQLICARFYLDADLASRAGHAWWALTRICHHHAYDLPPTPLEVADLLAEARAVTDEVARRS